MKLIVILSLLLACLGFSQTLVVKKIDQPFPSKKGVCFTLRNLGKGKDGKLIEGDYLTNMPKVEKLNAGWNYSWGLELRDNQPKGMVFAPMIYSVKKDLEVSELTLQLKKQLAPLAAVQKNIVLLGYNEPDAKSQGNLSVEKALKYWEALEAQNLPLCSPSCVHSNKEWMTEFMAGVKKNNLRVDYIGVHNYGGGNVKAFKKLLQDTYLAYDKRPIIVTEFAVADWNAKSPEKNKHSPEAVLKFMQEVLPWMEEQEWIAGYAWFSFKPTSSAGTSSALFDEKGNLTKLGEFYSTYKPFKK
jgi:hypothetical protein